MQPSEDPTQLPTTTQLDELVAQAREVVGDIDNANNEANAHMANLSTQVDETLGRLDEVYTQLDQTESDSSTQLDQLILQQAAYLGEE